VTTTFPQRRNRAPRPPTDIPARGWAGIFRRSVRQFRHDDVSDRAAALTYFGVLSIFPGLLVLVSILGLSGQSTTQRFLDNLREVAPSGVNTFLRTVVAQVQGRAGAAGVAAIVGLVVALSSASGYVAAFMRGGECDLRRRRGPPDMADFTGAYRSHARSDRHARRQRTDHCGDRPGCRPGRACARHRQQCGAGMEHPQVAGAAVDGQSDAFLLHWACPNVRQPGVRWITLGDVLAVLAWLIASGLFAVYVAFSSSYNKTYSSLAGVIVFLVWLWISNIAVLLGLEFDAESQRERLMRAGLPGDLEPFVELRDTRKLDEPERRRVAEADRIRREGPAP
jgi:membrane protein